MAHASSYGISRFQAGENDLWLMPRLYKRDFSKMGIVYCHGAGGLAVQPVSFNTDPAVSALVGALAEVYPIVAADLGGAATWGSATVQARVTAAKTWLQGAEVGAKPGKVLLVGTSMGGASILQWAKNNVASVAAIALTIPVTDLDDIYQNDRGGYRAAIAAAWGVVYPAALPADALGMVTYAQYNTIPIKVWTASDDPIALPAKAAALVAGVTPVGVQVNVGALGHSNAAIAAVPPADVLSFLQTYG